MMSAGVTEGRSFGDVLRVVDSMTNKRPEPCPNNLEVTKLLVDRLNMQSDLEKLRFVHVAGTKGKGTTSAYTAALLQAYGYKVGLFTSPHLTDVRERILVGNSLLSKDTFARYFFGLRDRFSQLAQSESQMCRDLANRSNFFRFMFLLSLYIFAEESVDVAVIEVGMGGRIDATNVVTPEVCVITALGLDHTEILGNTVQEITLEKAGIMKPGVICYAAPQNDHRCTRKVLEEHSRKVGSPVVFVDEQTLPIRNWPRLAIGGSHAIEDSKLGLLAARRVAGILPTLPLDEVERNVLRTMTFPGRSQVVPINGGADVTLYLDGAHTYESLSSATRWFMDESSVMTGDANPRRVLLFYSSRDPSRVLKAFMPFVQHFSKVVIAKVYNPRTVKTEESMNEENQAHKELVAVTECWRNLYGEVTCLPCGTRFNSLQDLIDLVVPAASDHEDASKPAQIFVTGSFFLIADVMKLISTHESSL
ncbi:folylpolyglutamate synthetase [Trypanosoma grayi]|uniref:folylpolyglutamate synthetase n=1 Tax=Trypanosoma grayi TaxID=71804 RepID=UPI0004F4450B|nr:folylpolyglutamate synthetase [Trypanosoma grayi]KEG11437.1 folylpolyglutamate synthetase [Trypanosoma grayi]